MIFKKVSDTVWRGSRPDCLADTLTLKKEGIKTVLSLERGWFEFFHGKLNQEFENCFQAELTPTHIQFSDVLPPSKLELDSCLELLKDKDLQNVFVHCLHGVDRTGLVIAAYRVKIQWWSIDAAIQEMYAEGFHKWSYFWWIPGFKKYLTS